jgi:hypothetical protein
MKYNVSQKNTVQSFLSSASYVQKISSASKGFTDFSVKGYAIHPSESGVAVKKVSWSCKNSWLSNSTALYFSRSFKYSMVFLNELYGYDTASLEQYISVMSQPSQIISSELAIDSARSLLANDKQNKGLADYITAENASINSIVDLKAIVKKYRRSCQTWGLLFLVSDILQDIILMMPALQELLAPVIHLAKIFVTSMVASVMVLYYFRVADLKPTASIKAKLLYARAKLTNSGVGIAFQFEKYLAPEIESIDHILSLVELKRILDECSTQDDLKALLGIDSNHNLRNQFDNAPKLLHPIAKHFIKQIESGDQNIAKIQKYIASMNVDYLAVSYLDDLDAQFKARFWILKFGYRRFKEFVEQLYRSKVLMTGASIIIFSAVLALGAPVSISAITAFALMLLIGDVVAKMLGDAVDTIIFSIKSHLQKLLSPVLSKIKSVDVSIKKEKLDPIRKEFIDIHECYPGVFKVNSNDSYFNPCAHAA